MRCFVAILALTLSVMPALAQVDPLRGADKQLYEEIKVGGTGDPTTAAAKAVLAKQAKILISPLVDPRRVSQDLLPNVVEEAIGQLPIQKPGSDMSKIKPLDPRDMQFVRAFGAALITELDPLLKHPKIVIRVNAARMLSVIGMMGYDGVAPVAVGIIKNPDESEGVKNYALEALVNILGFVVDPNLTDLSAFGKEGRSLEHQAIQALCDYVERKPKLDGKSPDEVAALQVIRRKAVRALGNARMVQVRFEGKTLSRPGLVLLKVAVKDGIVPEPDMMERALAINGFCTLFPVLRNNVDRDVDLDVASYFLGMAILDLVTAKPNAEANLPWIFMGNRWEASLKLFQENTNSMQIAGAATAKALHQRVKDDLTTALKANNPTVSIPNTTEFRNWLTSITPKTMNLIKTDPTTTINKLPGY